ncbi:MAG TPA: glycine dehydrogenase (aminomethyl-transferring), partial [Chitinophagales bacterium]
MSLNLRSTDAFVNRHIGVDAESEKQMLQTLGLKSVQELIDKTVPKSILRERPLNLPEGLSEFEYLQELKKLAAKNKVFKSYIGLGYYNTITPAAIRRNIFENPGWYTQYTPYQAEIAQGRLEALLNYQTVVSDLTALPIANASLLDEGTAAAEAMTMFLGVKNKKQHFEHLKFFVSEKCFPQTIAVVQTRASVLGIEVVVGNHETVEMTNEFFGALLQYPAADGSVIEYKSFIEKAHAVECYVTVAADLLSLALLTPPGEFGADCAIGNTQRFGVPMGFGGPHAAYFATKDEFKRIIPGRIIGISVDAKNKTALRMALQTREQHIRREKATSNICTAQALLAIMAGMYGVYHGQQGVKNIALRIHGNTQVLAAKLKALGYTITNEFFFDTLSVEVKDTATLKKIAEENEVNFFYTNNSVSISIDETTLPTDIETIVSVFAKAAGKTYIAEVVLAKEDDAISAPKSLVRTSAYLTHQVFNSHHTETQLMR